MADETPADEKPKRPRLEKIGTTLPIALAALATAFAGMSSSAMSRAMFWRSAAAQDQSRATSQWALAGFKRDRALIQETTVATMRAAAGVVGTDSSFTKLAPPDDRLPPPDDERIRATLELMRENRPDEEVMAVAGKIPHPNIDEAIRAGHIFERHLGDRWEPALKAAEAGTVKPRDAAAWTAAQADRYALDAVRNRHEARVNQDISRLYEVRVAVTSAESDRHRRRSENFFYAMLVAQVGATASSFFLARQRKSSMWAIAAVTGLVAIGFGGYVYATM